ncbi:acyltransferase [Patescibacteria group bacterium]|nr:acyltransferase [Patescibacteria group bacterium]MBU4000142.1 acyltransferase [Patescibacteria group bacterium]MBU4057240.1 acyltransferase [Patescibacteria group bacterium]MBU4368905.1 acyltransferase [Patescibacteria group bacterium]
MIDSSSRVVNSTIGKDTEVREYTTIHDSNIGDGCKIYERVSIKKSTIGIRTTINSGTYVEFTDIDDDVLVGPNCSLVGVFHELVLEGARRENSWQKTKIGKKAWIGANCVILPGVKIGEGAVIGAGTTVTKNIPPFHICIGIPPNQTKMSLKEWLRRKRHL